MSFQWRDWGLKLLIALSLILGVSPDIFDDPVCFSCDGGPNCDNPKITHTLICPDEDDGACFKTGVAGAMKRGCIANGKAQCILYELSQARFPGRCYNAIVHKEITEKIEQCIKRRKETPVDLSLYVNTSFCVCIEKSNCNDGPAEAALDRTTTSTTPKPDKPNPAGQSTSNSKLIFGVLTIAAIYNYSSGSTTS